MAFGYRDPFEQLQGEVERMLASAFGASGGVYPPVNVFDTGDAYVVKAELPGVAPGAIDVSVEHDVLTLRGERRVPAAGPDGAYHRRERVEGKFRRVVRLPGRLASDEATADYTDGVLTIRLAKAREQRPQRIEIKAA
jgi:HSP20 family protein